MVEILQNFVANTYVNLSDFAPRPLLLDKFPAPCLLISFKIPPPYPYILFCDFTTFTLIMMLQLFHPTLFIPSSSAIRGVIVLATYSKNNCGPICNSVFSCWKTPFSPKGLFVKKSETALRIQRNYTL